MSRVVVSIERLVLRGFSAKEQHDIAAGLRGEFARMLADREVMSVLRDVGDVPMLRVNGVSAELGLMAQRVGENVGRGIGEELSK